MMCSADTLKLKSGSFLYGTVGSISLDSVKFRSEDLGDVNVKIDRIEYLEDARQHRIRLVSNEIVSRNVVLTNGTLVVEDVKKSDIKTIDETPETWHGSINAGFNASRGNTYENSGSLVANVNRKWEKDRFKTDFGYYYGESGKVHDDRTKTTDRWELEAKHEHFWVEKVYHYEMFRYDRDMIQELSYRFRGGLGAGYYWLDGTVFENLGKFTFNQDLGVDYVKEEYDYENPDCRNNGYAAIQYSHHFIWIPKWVDDIEVFHNFEYLPEVDDFDKYLIKADAGFSKKLISDFTLLVKIEWDRNSMPAKDHKKDDLRYIVGLGYKW